MWEGFCHQGGDLAIPPCPQHVAALVDVCPAGAIIPDDGERVEKRQVGAVVLAIGAELFDPSRLENFGYGVHPDVVTGLEYERIMSASGPTGGELVRPSNGKPPQRVGAAFEIAPEEFEARKTFARFTPEDAELLRQLRPVIESHAGDAVPSIRAYARREVERAIE